MGEKIPLTRDQVNWNALIGAQLNNKAIKEQEEYRNRGGPTGNIGWGMMPRWEITLPPDYEGRTSGPFAFQQAIARKENEMLFARGPGSTDINSMDRERQSRNIKNAALAASGMRERVADDEKRTKDALVALHRELSLAGGGPSEEQQKRMWGLQDAYEEAAKKKAYFLKQHPKGDYMGWA